MKHRLLVLLYFLALVAVWETLVRAGLWSPVLVPSPFSVVEYLVNAVTDGTLWHAMLVTVRRLLIGYAIGLALGIGRLTDTALVRRAQRGDLAALEELVGRHERRVYTLARRITGHDHDAEDVTQQTFLSALEHLPTFRGDASFATWLLRITTHAALKIIRKRKGWPTESLDDSELPHPEYIADWRQNPVTLAQRAETIRLLDDALAELDQKHRLVFLLRDVEGLSVKETAAALDLSEANVKVRLLRARLQLRERLTRAFGDDSRRVAPHPH